MLAPEPLQLAGRAADGWVPSFRGDLKKIAGWQPGSMTRLPRAGRDPASLRRILNVGGVITDGLSDGVLRGPVDQWVDELTDLVVGYGFDTFILWAEGEGQLRGSLKK